MKKTFTEKINYLLCTALLSLLLAIVTNTASAQNDVTVKGHVADSKGLALPGVSIKLVGTAQGTVTDIGGAYKITASKTSRLQFSFLGYVTKTEEVGNRTAIDVTLADDASKALNEVVVVGYGTQKRTDVTGSVTSVPKARLSQLPVTNVLQALEGAVAGVNITTTSSVPGAQPAALVRGQNSIAANSGPYVVVDGIPLTKTGGSLNDINPNDIASMEILKDASAVAIYGTNGSQGVILITTKRGTTGKPVIRYSGYAGLENIAHILAPRDPASFTQKYLDYLSQNKLTQQFPEPVYNTAERANYAAGRTIDWVKEVTQQGIMQDHNVSISGGTPDTKYFISGDYLKQKGAVKGYQYNRVSIRSNLDFNVTDYLTIGATTFFANNNYDGGRAHLLFATAMSPYGNEYNPDGSYTIYPQLSEQLYTNPLLGLKTDQLSRSVNVNGNGYAELKFGGVLKGLKYRLNAGYTYLPTRTGSYSGRLANTPLGAASTTSSETTAFTLENLLFYTREFGKNRIDFTGLYSAQRRRWFTATASGTGYINDELSYNNIGGGSTLSSSSQSDRYAANSQMVRLNYGYDSRYLFTFTTRRDGSSVFGANTNKYGVFPVGALAWNISNEKFLRNSKFIDNLKLRVSYGKTGNEAVPVYRTITTDNTVRFPFNGISYIGVQAGNLGNGNLHWEETLGTNFGVDFSLFKSRVSGTIDLYDNKTSGLLLNRALPTITGYNQVLFNIGKVANKGVEVTLNTRNIVSSDFKWESLIVFAANKNRLVDLYGDGLDDLGNRWFIGKPISVVYDYRMTGVWQTGEDASKQDPGAKPGDLKFADLNGDGKITADLDKEILGQTAPKWTGGLTNTFHYKNVNLSVFIQTAQGMTKNDADYNYADEAGRRNTPAEIGYWTPTNASNQFQSLSYTNTRGYGYAHDASYTRIKDITLSYVFAPKMLEKMHLAGLTVYASGRNLKTFTNWIGWDPENNYQTRGSGDFANNYPLARTFVFGVNVSLK